VQCTACRGVVVKQRTIAGRGTISGPQQEGRIKESHHKGDNQK